MADNTTLSLPIGVGGDVVRSVQKGGGAGPKSQVQILDIGGSGGESLLAATALQDALANPTAILTGACILGWDGSNWDRLKSSLANGLQVDVTRVQGTVGTNVTALNGTTVSTGIGVADAGTQRVAVAGGNSVPVLATITPQAAGNSFIYNIFSSGSPSQDSHVAKDHPGQVYGWVLSNTTSSARYVKLYDLANGGDSTQAPKIRIMVPPLTTLTATFPTGIGFTTGVSLRITTGAADNDTGACSSYDVLINLFLNAA